MDQLYQILNIDNNANEYEIKKAYHKLARLYHPDKMHSESNDKFQEIQNAYQILSDPIERNKYDMHGSPDSPDGPDVQTFFDEIFLNNSKSKCNKGSDMNIHVKVSLEDLYQRKKKRITFVRKRNYNGYYIDDKLTIKIAVEDIITVLPNEADEQPNYSLCGDVVIHIEINPHERFTCIEDYDILYIKKISISAIYYDYYFIIQHLDGQPLYLKCGAHTIRAKHIHKIKGYGLPISKLDQTCRKRGDLYIKYEIEYPETLQELKECSYNCQTSDNHIILSITTCRDY